MSRSHKDGDVASSLGERNETGLVSATSPSISDTAIIEQGRSSQYYLDTITSCADHLGRMPAYQLDEHALSRVTTVLRQQELRALISRTQFIDEVERRVATLDEEAGLRVEETAQAEAARRDAAAKRNDAITRRAKLQAECDKLENEAAMLLKDAQNAGEDARTALAQARAADKAKRGADELARDAKLHQLRADKATAEADCAIAQKSTAQLAKRVEAAKTDHFRGLAVKLQEHKEAVKKLEQAMQQARR